MWVADISMSSHTHIQFILIVFVIFAHTQYVLHTFVLKTILEHEINRHINRINLKNS